MSLSVEGQKCPVCHAYLFDDEDIVFCPICGAPHHRDCYNAIGHCALEDNHGTDEQYDASVYKNEEIKEERVEEKENVVRCRFCGNELTDDANFCPHCRAPRENATMNPFGDIKKDTVLEDGIKAEQLARFTLINPSRYVKKFFSLNNKNRISWNWAAFLFPCEWSLYRKCYKSGVLMGILLVAAALLTMPLDRALSQFVLEDANYQQMTALLLENSESIGLLPMILSLISGAITLGVRVFAGMFGDYIYRGTAIERIKEIEASQDEKEDLYRKKGGVNILLFLAAYIVRSYLPTIIFMFLR